MSERSVSNHRELYAAVIVLAVLAGALLYFSFAGTLLFFMVGWLFLIPFAGFVYMVQGFQAFRTVSKNISLEKEYIEKLKPSLEKHEGNFSAAIRDVIYQTAGKRSAVEPVSLDNLTLNWMMEEVDGLLLPDVVLDQIIDPALISSMEHFESFMNEKFKEHEWDTNLNLKYDSNVSPSDVLAEIKGDSSKLKLAASLVSQFLVKKSLDNDPLRIKYMVNMEKVLRVEFSRSSRTEAEESLVTFFGGAEKINNIIKGNPDFWKGVIGAHVSSDYNMVTVHRNYFEDLFTDKIPPGEITIENLARRHIRDIPLDELISLIKLVYESSRIVDRVEISRENLILFHSYRNKNAIERLTQSIVMLLKASGHEYEARSTANMIILTHPDIR